MACTAGYRKILIYKGDNPRKAFTSHCGTYQRTSLLFGLFSAPATLQCGIDMILSGGKWQNEPVCPNELIMFSADAESHLHHLDTVITLLGHHGVTLKAPKCHLCCIEVVSLWNVFRPRRLIVNEKNLESIKRVVFPKTEIQLRSSLGIHNVCRW